MARQSPNATEALEEILGSLRITRDNVSNRSIELVTPETSEEISTAPIVYNETV